MEDQKRGMGTPQGQIPPVRTRAKDEHRVTVMILRGVGKVRSFRISPHLFIWAALFFLAYILCSVLIINKYIGLRKQSAIQSQKIGVLETRSMRDEKDLIRSKQHIALLEDYIQSLENPKKEAPTTPKTEGTPTKKAAPVQAEKSRPAQPEEITSTMVDVKDLVIQKDQTKMRINFKLVNTLKGDETVGGYYDIIARDDSSNPPEIWTYPQQELVNGLPANFKHGKVFLIQRFKPVHWRIDITPGSKSHSSVPSSIMVLVYDQSGRLILRKSFAVDHDS